MRFPSLAIGLGLGIVLSFITSRFEEVLSVDIRIAFFIPFVVYVASAVGSQTQNIYIRDLKKGTAQFHNYLFKETIIGVVLGVATGIIAFLGIELVFGSYELAKTVGLGMFLSIMTAPLIALIVAEILELEHTDPAVGAGPIVTVIQDMVSILIYGLVASSVFL
jgi:magnesium transporter